MIYLETDRLVLRSLRREDLDILHAYRNSAVCAKYQRGQEKGRSEIAALIEAHGWDVLFEGDTHRLAIALKGSGEMVGDVVTFYRDRTITLGYTISHHHHRKGYAFEMLSALTEALHERFPDREVVCCVDPENAASIGLLKKLGFVDLGYAGPIHSQIFAKWPVED